MKTLQLIWSGGVWGGGGGGSRCFRKNTKIRVYDKKIRTFSFFHFTLCIILFKSFFLSFFLYVLTSVEDIRRGSVYKSAKGG